MAEVQTIQVHQDGDVYSCDIGISKEEWLGILQDGSMPDEYRDALLRFYYMPEHRGTCTSVSNEIGGDAQSLNSYITKVGQFVQKKLNRFQIVRPNGKPCFWIVPMREGKDLPKGNEGTFEWVLRPELAEAIRDYLYWYLVERYKEVRKDIPIDGEKYDEIYKWNLITSSQGKSPIEVVKAHVAHPSKSEFGGFRNLIDAARDNKALKYLVEFKPSELEKALNHLSDESIELNKRLLDFKSSIAVLLPPTGYNSKANDERTASVILTCVNPEEYTIYKYDVYTLFCKYLGEEKKSAGQCYHHFLELIKPLRQLAAQDNELHQIVAPSLDGQLQSDSLLAQDILWILMIEFTQALGFIRPIMLPTKQRVWLWSGDVNTYMQDSLGCGSSAKTIKDFTIYKSKSALRKAYQKDVGNTDLKVPDAYWSFTKEVSVGDIIVVFEPKKGNGKLYHLLHGWGVFSSDCTIVEDDENPMRREIEWHSFLKIPIQNTEMGNSVFFQGTTEKQAKRIMDLLNINLKMNMEPNYQKYINLLETNKNLILTGAPGTGKTYMAKEIAKAMGCTDKEISFVQFHPSYDYTDFVEGLRPMTDGNGNVGFERKDGVFKQFCKQSLDAYRPIGNKELEKVVTFDDAYDRFINDLSKSKNVLEFERVRSASFKVSVGDDSVLRIDGTPIKKDLVRSFYNRTNSNNWYSKHCELIIDYLRKHYFLDEVLYQSRINPDFLQKCIFIIDEINRGEISKIFGELFFSIDPGYRGEKGKVNTQYQNLIDENDVFKDGFYVPKNVYIIGTMNDIDRSVESMDFAMRRRFAWQEVTAEESYTNMIENEPEFALVKDEIKQRMFNLNKAIAETEGLDEAYQIGAAYFRKYLDYQDKENPFDCLWNNHLKGLLFEYLRGNRRAKELLEKLHKAYNKTNIDE